MTPRFEIRWMIAVFAMCFYTTSLIADDAPKAEPPLEAPNAAQGPIITPGPSAPEQNWTEPVPGPDFQPWAADPNFPQYPPVPFIGFNFGYGYRPMGYSFWPRYGNYSDFSEKYFMYPTQFYREPYTWRSYEALPPYLQVPY